MEKFYELADGSIVREYALSQAFLITTGVSPLNEPELFSKFLQGLDNSKYAVRCHYTVEELVTLHQYTCATVLYREQNNCTLAEAHAVVDKMREEV